MKPPKIINPQTVGINRTINLGLGPASERQDTRINRDSSSRESNSERGAPPNRETRVKSQEQAHSPHVYIRRVMRRPENDLPKKLPPRTIITGETDWNTPGVTPNSLTRIVSTRVTLDSIVGAAFPTLTIG